MRVLLLWRRGVDVKNWLGSFIRRGEPQQRASVEEVLRDTYRVFRRLLRVRRMALEMLTSPHLQDSLRLPFDRARETLECLGALEGCNQLDLEAELQALKGRESSAANRQALEELLARAHDHAIERISRLLDGYETDRIKVRKVRTGLPINLHVLDLGGGLPDGSTKPVLKEEITSLPMQAMFRGMYHPGITWSGPIGINLKGLMIVMAQSSGRPEEVFWDKTIALVAPEYMSYHSRLGYHYASANAYVSDEAFDNYVRFAFKGGAADDQRRARRARFIATVLERSGFSVRVQKDLVSAGFLRQPNPQTEEKLDLLGRLMGCSRQRDMVMDDEDIVDWHIEAFLRGNYSFDPEV